MLAVAGQSMPMLCRGASGTPWLGAAAHVGMTSDADELRAATQLEPFNWLTRSSSLWCLTCIQNTRRAHTGSARRLMQLYTAKVDVLTQAVTARLLSALDAARCRSVLGRSLQAVLAGVRERRLDPRVADAADCESTCRLENAAEAPSR